MLSLKHFLFVENLESNTTTNTNNPLPSHISFNQEITEPMSLMLLNIYDYNLYNNY